MASAWQYGAYLRLGLSYLLAAFLHGLWNALNIITGLGALLTHPPASLRPLANLARVAPLGVVLLAVLLFALLWGSNTYLQRQSQIQPVFNPSGSLAEEDAEPGGSDTSISH
jgi:hypothetical protein